jgi:DNA-binding transcriptional ArsR family regulator
MLNPFISKNFTLITKINQQQILIFLATVLNLLLVNLNSTFSDYLIVNSKDRTAMNLVSNYTMVLNGDETPVKVDFVNLKKGAMILRALNHKLRQQIIKLIDEKKRITVTEIYVHLRLEQSVASQHLAILRRAGIVKTDREGKFIYYSVSAPRIAQIMHCIDELIA